MKGYASVMGNLRMAASQNIAAKKAEKKAEKIYGSKRNPSISWTFSLKFEPWYSLRWFKRHFKINWPYTVKIKDIITGKYFQSFMQI